MTAFEKGATSGKSSSMSIEQLGDGYTALVGYGHAAYAVRGPAGKIVRFDGWAFKNCRPHQRSGSMSTKTNHFAAMRSMGDVRIAYEKANTGMERDLKEGADIVTGDAHRAAPSVRQAKDTFKSVSWESVTA